MWCCEDPEYRSLPDVVNTDEVNGNIQGDLSVSRCTACGRRHFELSVDMGRLGLVGTAL